MSDLNPEKTGYRIVRRESTASLSPPLISCLETEVGRGDGKDGRRPLTGSVTCGNGAAGTLTSPWLHQVSLVTGCGCNMCRVDLLELP